MDATLLANNSDSQQLRPFARSFTRDGLPRRFLCRTIRNNVSKMFQRCNALKIRRRCESTRVILP